MHYWGQRPSVERMGSRLAELALDANDPLRLAAFWSGMLRRGLSEVDDLVVVRPANDLQLPIVFLPTDAPKAYPNWTHFDLTSSTPQDQQETVDRALSLGARHHDVGQGPDAGTRCSPTPRATSSV